MKDVEDVEPVRKRGRVVRALLLAVAAGGTLLATPASGVAADSGSAAPADSRGVAPRDAGTRDAGTRDIVTLMGPYATKKECVTEREEFARYYETSPCYMPDPILAWYFEYRKPA